jgi:Na+-transporting methylmalonyl-CoA/oxaloacetate decarboxylase gamma subunit
MENPLVTVLMITVLGMGLLFLALAFFYGLLSAMARGLKDRALRSPQAPATCPEDAGEEEGRSLAETRLKAAAVAIALARARVQASPPGGPAPPAEALPATQPPSAWWSLHHQRRLASGSSRGRGQ